MIRFLAGRYSGMNITWQGVDYFEDYPGWARHPQRDWLRHQRDGRLSPPACQRRPHVTSAPLLDDGWEDFAAYGTRLTIMWAPWSINCSRSPR